MFYELLKCVRIEGVYGKLNLVKVKTIWELKFVQVQRNAMIWCMKYMQSRLPFKCPFLLLNKLNTLRHLYNFWLTDPHGAAVQTHHVHTYSYHDNVEEDPDLCELTEKTIQVQEGGVVVLK